MNNHYKSKVYFTALFFLILWVVSLFSFPNLTILIAILGPLLTYLFIRLSEYGKTSTLDEYFLFNRQMPSKMFGWTFVTTNIGLFSSIAFSTILSYYYGIAGMIWTLVAWFLGIWWFSRKIPYFLNFFKTGSTIHEYIAESYGKNAFQKRTIRTFTAIVTLIIYWASIGVEIKFGADVLTPSLGLNNPIIIALIIAMTGFTYSYLAGYKGVVYTDAIQFWLMILGAISIIIYIYISVIDMAFSLPTEYFSLTSILVGPEPLGLISLFALLVVYQFSIMDMWQRCIAVVNSSDFNNASDDNELIKQMRNVIFKKTFFPFLIFFLVWFAIGIFVLGTGLTDNINEILPVFLNSFDTNNLISLALKSIIVSAFISAILSTIDSLLVAASQMVVYDIYAISINKGLSNEIHSLSKESQEKLVEISRLVVLFLGTTSIIFAFLTFDLLNFWVGMYSIMLSFFPPIYLKTINNWNTTREYKFILIGIVGGSLGALLISIIGTFILPSSTLVYLAPLVALGISSIFTFPKFKKRG